MALKTFVFKNLRDSNTGKVLTYTCDVDKIEAEFRAARERGENPLTRSQIAKMAQDSAKQLLSMK